MNSHLFSKRHINKIGNKLLLLGSNENRALPYLTLKSIFVISLVILVATINVYGLIIAPLLLIFLNIFLDYVVLDHEIKIRKTKLEKDAIIFFKVLYFNYINNRNLKVALKITTNNINNSLSLEFKKALDETSVGKSIYDALNDLEKRIPSSKINAIINHLNEAILLGNDADLLLKKQITYLELNEINKVDRIISIIPIKVMISFLLIILPIIVIIISF